MNALYSFALSLALIISSPWWLARMALSGKYRHGLKERLGSVPPRLRSYMAGHQAIWVHAVSVGEVNSAIPLILRLREQLAATNIRVVVSTTTQTGQRIARDRLGEESVFYFPLDFRFALRRYYAALNPRLLVLMETELWPNYIAFAAARKVPIIVLNARISDRSLPRYLRLRFLWRHILSHVSAFLAQSTEDARRLVRIGAPKDRVINAGNLKFDLPFPAEPPIVAQLRAALTPSAPILVCGSTAPEEEKQVVRWHRKLLEHVPNLVTILAPRHPDRFPEIDNLLRKSGVNFIRRSQWIENPAPIAPGSIFLLDSIGELAAVYSLGTVAFVGGSLIDLGGHNPLEPMLYNVPVIVGPYTHNFRAIMETLTHRLAIGITTQSLFIETTKHFLTHPTYAAQQAANATAVLEKNRGAADRSLQKIFELLGPIA
jgi:3-deoxy-D-manno-octulosonic-acid transferase